MPPFDTEVPVLLLRLDPNPFHHGTLGAVRSLGRTGIEVHLAQGTPGPVDRSRFVHRMYSLPPDGTSDAELELALSRVSDAIGRPAVLIALDDRGAIAVAALADRLRSRGFLLPDTAPGLPARVADKAELAGLCRDLGIAHPVTVAPDSAAAAAREAALLGLPVVAKWSRPWLLPKGMRSTTLVRTPAEAGELYEMSAHAGSRLLLQQRLPGGRGTDWFFHGYADGDRGFLVGGSGRKERSWPPRTGLTAVGTWIANHEVEEEAARLAARVGYRGILDLDFRFDPATGTYNLLDFNPRPGAQFRLFTDDGGLDVVRAQHLHLTGREVPAQRGGPGRVFVAENYALLSAMVTVVSLGMLRKEEPQGPGARGGRGGRGARDELGDHRGFRPRGRYARGPGRAVERAWFAADDPRPFFAMAGAWLARGALKIWHRVRSVRAALPASTPGLPSAPHFRSTRDERSVKDQREGNACTTS
ncbi:ATP-grasp domain-containing protein [Streptomyces sp. WMMB 322]|uniref:carboxylate--amine ligase n=1 Tax=Streptomyces sp. WMMB 322 TaxID=1286821 RepID=UPI00082399EB|nr:ATP-grasp domain-containing protein [Streptomyces sp. WMMB 322]SCK51441.1 Predicted ATP-dependent carboligase, ATP-grasp superfamily [Streptomyces sp. WMMB 322]